MNKISIIDAPCGAGKTSWAIQEMERHPEQPYIYCTPLLSEIKRIREACSNHRFQEPHNYEQTKIDDFNDLLERQVDIAVTHSTFLNATPQTIDLIQRGHYEVFIDEAVDILAEFNKTHLVKDAKEQTVTEGDVQKLLDGKFIEIDPETHRVKWIGRHYDDGKYTVFEQLARMNRIYWIREKMMVCIFPPEIFSAFSSTTVLTYLFEGSPLSSYFDLFGHTYEKKTVCRFDDEYALAAFTPDSDAWFRENAQALISVCDSKSLNDYGRYALSRSWYDRNAKKEGGAQLKRHLEYYFRKVANAKASRLVGEGDLRQTEIMWTCYKDFQTDISGKGFTRARQLTKGELDLPKNDREALEKRLSCFVPNNARATNDYRDRWALAYCCNMYYPDMLKALFADNGIDFDDDKFALSCLIQWIYRSRIRDGLPITLYLPSVRMRKLYFDWLNGVM